MIASNLELSRDIANRIKLELGAHSFPAGLEDLGQQLVDTIQDPDFPGALIPTFVSDGDLEIVAAANPADWRRLSPVLRAFAGSTLSSFDGMPSKGPVDGNLDTLISAARPLTTAVIRLPSGTKRREAALRAMVRARETIKRAPSLTRSAPEPTSWLLARFQDCLNVGRREDAESILKRLREEFRLDALNLKALQVQLLAAFGDWAKIVELPGFENLVRARRTPATTAILLEALYKTRISQHFNDGDEGIVVEQYRTEVRNLVRSILVTPPPKSLRQGGWRMVGLEFLCAPDRTDLSRVLNAHLDKLGWLQERIKADLEKSADGSEQTAIDQARDRLVTADTTESVDAMASALEALSNLTEEQRNELIKSEPFKSVVQTLEAESGASSLPTSWVDWFKCVSDPGFTNALDIARMGAEEWDIAGKFTDPASVQKLLEGLNQAQSDPIASERTAQALPYVVAAVKKDDNFPNAALVPAYSSLLTLMALGSARGHSIYESSLVLVDALLNVGTDADGYADLVADIEEISGEGFGVGMIYWVLEVIEVFMRAAAPDAKARDRLVHGMLARITPLRGRLSLLQRESLKQLAEEFGWQVPGLDEESKKSEATDFGQLLSGKRIGIYSLVESAAQQAKVTLEKLTSSVQVDCNSDHGGSGKLRALAENSDLFVVVWGAAKHAATDFIRVHRGDRPLVYAEGKGFSSILRAVEDYYS